MGICTAEQPLEGSQSDPALILLHSYCRPSIKAFLALERNNGWKPVEDLPIRRFKVHERIVPTIYRGNYYPRCTEINPNPHALSLTSLGLLLTSRGMLIVVPSWHPLETCTPHAIPAR